MPDDGETFARRDPERAKGLRCLFAGSSRIVRRAYLLRSTLMLRLLLCLGLGLIVSVPVSTAQQVGQDGKPYATLPPVMNTGKKPPVPDARFARDLPNKPFLIDPYVGLEDKDPNLTHLWYQQQVQIDGGKMDKFAAISNAGGL